MEELLKGAFWWCLLAFLLFTALKAYLKRKDTIQHMIDWYRDPNNAL